MKMQFKLIALLILLLCLSSCGDNGPAERMSVTLGEDVPRPPVNLSVRNEVKSLVERCASQMTVNEMRVNRFIPWSDNGPPIRALYTIRRGDLNLPIVIELEIYAHYEDPAVLPRLQAMIPGVEGFFARYGIKINLIFEFSNHYEPGPAIRADKHVHLGNDFCQSHMEQWCFPPEQRDWYWTTISHELGHALGLADEYGDREFPNRFIAPETNPVSLMNGFAPDEYLDLYPRHIRQILEPVCPGL